MMSTMLPAAMKKGLLGVSATLCKTPQQATASMSSMIVKPISCDKSSATTTTTGTSSGFHRSAQRDYPLAEPLPLPANIDLNESTRFSPQRHRDLNATILAAHQHAHVVSPIDITVDQSTAADDAHIGRYDCNGAVSLCASMQSNVPSPFGGMHKFTHLNMPGGQHGQGIRLVASDQQQSHYYTNLRREARQNWSAYDEKATVALAAASPAATVPPTGGEGSAFGRMWTRRLHSSTALSRVMNANSDNSCCAATSHYVLTPACACFTRGYATPARSENAKVNTQAPAAQQATAAEVQLTRGEKLKKAVKEYGATVIVFHVGISLVSLGTCYALVSSGLDVVAILRSLGWGESALSARLEAGGAVASTFVIAYAVHKCFAPVRISITLGATPFIVRYLRRRGILKAVAPTTTTTTPPPPSPPTP